MQKVDFEKLYREMKLQAMREGERGKGDTQTVVKLRVVKLKTFGKPIDKLFAT